MAYKNHFRNLNGIKKTNENLKNLWSREPQEFKKMYADVIEALSRDEKERWKIF